MLVRLAVGVTGFLVFALAVLCAAAPTVSSGTYACAVRMMTIDHCAQLDPSTIDDLRTQTTSDKILA